MPPPVANSDRTLAVIVPDAPCVAFPASAFRSIVTVPAEAVSVPSSVCEAVLSVSPNPESSVMFPESDCTVPLTTMVSPASNTTDPPVERTVTDAFTVMSSPAPAASCACAVNVPDEVVLTANTIGLLAVSVTVPPAAVFDEVVTDPTDPTVNPPPLATSVNATFPLPVFENAIVVTFVSSASPLPIPLAAVKDAEEAVKFSVAPFASVIPNAAVSVSVAPAALTLPTSMSPLPVVVPDTLLEPPAVTDTSDKEPPAAVSVIVPSIVDADVTVRPSAESSNAIAPVPVTDSSVAVEIVVSRSIPDPAVALRLSATTFTAPPFVSVIAPADKNVTTAPEAVTKPTWMSPPPVVVASTSCVPPATTNTSAKSPSVAVSVIGPSNVVADVTVNPSAVSSTAIAPVPDTERSVAVVIVVSRSMPVTELADNSLPDTFTPVLFPSVIPPVVAVNDTLPLVLAVAFDAIDAAVNDKSPLVEETPIATVRAPATVSVTVPAPSADKALSIDNAPTVTSIWILPPPAAVDTPEPPIDRPFVSSSTISPLVLFVACSDAADKSTSFAVVPIPVAADSDTRAPDTFATTSTVVSPASKIAPLADVTTTADVVAFVVVRPVSVISPAADTVIVPVPALIVVPTSNVIAPPPVVSASAVTDTLPLPLATSPATLNVTFP